MQDTFTIQAAKLIAQATEENVLAQNRKDAMIEAEGAIMQDQLLRCLRYLQSEAEPTVVKGRKVRKTQDQIASEFGLTRQGLEYLKKNWRDSGILQRAKDMLQQEMVDRYRATVRDLVENFDAIVYEQLDIAMDKSERSSDRLKSAQFIYELIQPTLASASVNESEPLAIPDGAGFNPLSLVKSIRVTIEPEKPAPLEAIDTEFTES